MKYKDYIEINPNIRFGKPVIKGTRISVFDVLGWLASEMSFDDIMNDYPSIKKEHILACLAYSADKERKVKIA
ncbi:MAG: DUF433 domain-containing protein [Cyclobacteriaceae bacterium]|nr:DUF433 domain-containing protein [Cyclobacteriaceae bacterium]